jgi:phospholipase/lecithinase/hemolysin
VLLGTIPPLSPAKNTAQVQANTAALNQWITTSAAGLSSPRMTIRPMELNSPLSGLMGPGGTHPTSEGYAAMADQWWNALIGAGVVQA